MSHKDMPGNVHYANVRQFDNKPMNALEISVMNAQAIAALAYEQRTANLIAYWDTMTTPAEPWANTPFQRELDDMHRDIRTRLGRTPEVPK